MMNKKCVRYSLEERKEIERMIGLGMTNLQISKAIGRTRWSLKNEIKKAHGNRHCYRAEEAHQASFDRWQKRSDLLSVIRQRQLEANGTYALRQSLTERLYGLEQVLSIVLERIDEIEKQIKRTKNEV